MENNGEVKLFNTAKQESEQIVFPIIEGHKFAIRQARTGELKDVPVEKISKNQKKLNRVKALHLIISSQKDMIQIARPIARYKSFKDWEKKHKGAEQDNSRLANPFDKDDNDYNKLMDMRKLLDFFDNEIIKADKSVTKDDDFLVEIQVNNGEENESQLTRNFYDMLNELEDTYEEIYIILIKHKIVSAGISEDEEMDYKDKEAEAIRRVTEA